MEMHEDEVKTNALMKSLEANRYDLFRQVDKQCIVDEKLDRFGKALTRLTRRTRSKIEEVDSFLSQKEKVQKYGISDGGQDADEEVDKDLNVMYSRRSMLSMGLVECPTCQQRILKSMWNDHSMVCSMVAKKTASPLESELLATERLNSHRPAIIPNAAVRPKPPRNLRVRAVDFESITIEWETTIFDGGESIMDYEIVYSIQPLPKQKNQRSRRVSLQCSRWCLAKPIPEKSFAIDNLAAGTNYSDLKLRCRNKVGWSDFCQKIESVTTAGEYHQCTTDSIPIVRISLL